MSDVLQITSDQNQPILQTLCRRIRTLICHVVMPAHLHPTMTFSPFRHSDADVVLPKDIRRDGNNAPRKPREKDHFC